MVIAALVIGIDGSSSLDGSSSGLSTPEDRGEFLDRRRLSDCILVGGKTAALESYKRTPVPLVVVSHHHPKVLEENQKAYWWNISPGEAIDKARELFGESIMVEGGISFLRDLLREGKIDQLNLTLTQRTGGENKVEKNELFSYFSEITVRTLGAETTIYECTKPKQK